MTPVQRMDKSFKVANEEFDIPLLLEPQLVQEDPDELSIMTYVTYFRRSFDDKATNEQAMIYGQGVEHPMANETNEFTIVPQKPEESDNIQVKVTDSEGNQRSSKVTQNPDGSFTVSYVAGSTGPHKIEVSKRG